jgi:hypothetical protein
LVLSCCSDSDSLYNEQARRHDRMPESTRPPEVAVVPYSTNSGLAAKDRMIATDPVVWSKIWLNIAGPSSPAPPLPPANFDRETIVIAGMGRRSSGGYSITIDSAGVAGDSVILTVTERSPGPTCGTTSALTAPVALARILRPKAPIRLIEKTAVSNCG